MHTYAKLFVGGPKQLALALSLPCSAAAAAHRLCPIDAELLTVHSYPARPQLPRTLLTLLHGYGHSITAYCTDYRCLLHARRIAHIPQLPRTRTATAGIMGTMRLVLKEDGVICASATFAYCLLLPATRHLAVCHLHPSSLSSATRHCSPLPSLPSTTCHRPCLPPQPLLLFVSHIYHLPPPVPATAAALAFFSHI
jgi:hypothetical protein